LPNTARNKQAAPKRPAPRPTARGSRAAGAVSVVKPVLRVAQELRRWADTMLGVAGSAADLSMTVTRARARGPGQKAAIEKAGALLRRARQAAGLTTQELGAAIDLSDASLLDQAERGKVSLPFEVILRLAGILGRTTR
jgi:DNA-binding XRE family transcriptional regulator